MIAQKTVVFGINSMSVAKKFHSASPREISHHTTSINSECHSFPCYYISISVHVHIVYCTGQNLHIAGTNTESLLSLTASVAP